MIDCIIKELKCPRTGRVFMWDLIEVEAAPTVANVVAAKTVVTEEIKESSSPTQMDLKIQRKLETLLAKESLTEFEALTLEKLQQVKQIYINESLTQGK